MRKFVFFVMVIFFGCDELVEIQEIDGPCTIVLADGSTITSNGNIEILSSTKVLTYRDEDGKLWSLTPEEYQSYDCSPI